MGLRDRPHNRQAQSASGRGAGSTTPKECIKDARGQLIRQAGPRVLHAQAEVIATMHGFNANRARVGMPADIGLQTPFMGCHACPTNYQGAGW